MRPGTKVQHPGCFYFRSFNKTLDLKPLMIWYVTHIAWVVKQRYKGSKIHPTAMWDASCLEHTMHPSPFQGPQEAPSSERQEWRNTDCDMRCPLKTFYWIDANSAWTPIDPLKRTRQSNDKSEEAESRNMNRTSSMHLSMKGLNRCQVQLLPREQTLKQERPWSLHARV